MATETVPVHATPADALHGQASETYDVLALLDALTVLGERGCEQDEPNTDTVARVAHVAHKTLFRITERLFEIVAQLRSLEVDHG